MIGLGNNFTIKTSYGNDQIKVPRDRDASYNPMIIPKRKSMVEGLENVIVDLLTLPAQLVKG